MSRPSYRAKSVLIVPLRETPKLNRKFVERLRNAKVWVCDFVLGRDGRLSIWVREVVGFRRFLVRR